MFRAPEKPSSVGPFRDAHVLGSLRSLRRQSPRSFRASHESRGRARFGANRSRELSKFRRKSVPLFAKNYERLAKKTRALRATSGRSLTEPGSKPIDETRREGVSGSSVLEEETSPVSGEFASKEGSSTLKKKARVRKPGRPKKLPEARQDRKLSVRFTGEEKEKVRRESERLGLKLGEYARRAILGRTIAEPLESSASSSNVEFRDIARLGKNLNQMTRGISSLNRAIAGGSIPSSPKVEAQLRAVLETLDELKAELGRVTDALFPARSSS